MTRELKRDYEDLKPEYQALYDEYLDMDRGCSCHINPPCSDCVHEGNPMNLNETDDAWKEVE